MLHDPVLLRSASLGGKVEHVTSHSAQQLHPPMEHVTSHSTQQLHPPMEHVTSHSTQQLHPPMEHVPPHSTQQLHPPMEHVLSHSTQQLCLPLAIGKQVHLLTSVLPGTRSTVVMYKLAVAAAMAHYDWGGKGLGGARQLSVVACCWRVAPKPTVRLWAGTQHSMAPLGAQSRHFARIGQCHGNHGPLHECHAQRV
jgi:hypothetical protein